MAMGDVSENMAGPPTAGCIPQLPRPHGRAHPHAPRGALAAAQGVYGSVAPRAGVAEERSRVDASDIGLFPGRTAERSPGWRHFAARAASECGTAAYRSVRFADQAHAAGSGDAQSS